MKTPAPERAANRRKLAAAGQALPGGSEPIPDVEYLKKAIRSVGRLDPSKRPALKKLIVKRARELKATSAPGVKGTWAFQGGNDGGALEFVGPEGFVHGWKYVGGGDRAHVKPLGMSASGSDIHSGDRVKVAGGMHKGATGTVMEKAGGNKLYVKSDDGSTITAQDKHLYHTDAPAPAARAKLKLPRGSKRPAMAHANDSEALEMAMPARRMPVVRGPADVQASRTAPGVISVMHKSTGTRVGVINSVPGGFQPVHASGKTLPVSPQMAPAMAGLIAWHNKMAAQKAATAQAMTPAAPAAVAPMAKAYANDGEQEALDFAGAIPVTTSGDGPRITAMAGGKKGRSIPAAKLTMAAQGTSGGMTAEVAKVYKKLIAKGFKPAQAMAFAKRAAAMHAKAVARKAA